MSLTSIVEHWTPWSNLSYNQASMPGLRFDFMFNKIHPAHIELSKPMSNIVQQGSGIGSCPTSPSLNRHYNPNFGSLSLCEVLFGWRQ